MNKRILWSLGLLGVLMLSGAAFYAWYCHEDVEPATPVFRESTENVSRSRALANGVFQTGMPKRAARHISYEESSARTTNDLVRLPFGKERPYDIRYAEHKGALGRVTFHVVDTEGNSVPGATVRGGFYNNGKEGHGFSEQTDAEGLLTVQDTCTGDLNFDVRKTGCYQTRHRYWFFKAGFDCVEDGRWIPWNPVLKVVLKEVRNPVEMKVGRKGTEWKVFPRNEEVGFDFEANDFVEPVGVGKYDDIKLYFSNEVEKVRGEHIYTWQLTLTSDVDGGLFRLPKDIFSEFKSVYVAPKAGYEKKIIYTYKRSQNRVFIDMRASDQEYVIVKSRVRKDEDGNIIDKHYGKIYGLEFVNGKEGAQIKLNYSFNPNSNDPNLERKRDSPHDGVL